jgi:hypothetical protein
MVRYLSKTKTPPPNEVTDAQFAQPFHDVSENKKSVHCERGKDLELPPPKKQMTGNEGLRPRAGGRQRSFLLLSCFCLEPHPHP